MFIRLIWRQLQLNCCGGNCGKSQQPNIEWRLNRDIGSPSCPFWWPEDHAIRCIPAKHCRMQFTPSACMLGPKLKCKWSQSHLAAYLWMIEVNQCQAPSSLRCMKSGGITSLRSWFLFFVLRWRSFISAWDAVWSSLNKFLGHYYGQGEHGH